MPIRLILTDQVCTDELARRYRTCRDPAERGPLHLVSAWATANHVALGQVATDDHSNEITAIPALLEALALEGTTVTIDAMGCQTAIADRIVAGGGAYVLALKASQGTLHELAAHHFTVTDGSAAHRTVDQGHGRLEIRTCRATDDSAVLRWSIRAACGRGCAASPP